MKLFIIFRHVCLYVSNVSSFPNAFPLVLDPNLHDLNETNPRLTLFSVELPWCCFLCRNKSSRNGTKLCEDFLYKIREFLEPRTTEGGQLGGHNPPGRAPLQARPGGLSPPSGPADLNPDTIKSYFRRKNQGERIITFHEME